MLFAVNSPSQNRQKSSTVKKFKIYADCMMDCQAVTMTFDYGNNFQIYVSIGYSNIEPGVTVNKSGTDREFILNRKPSSYFVEKTSDNKVDSTLNAILLKVYRVGSYCNDRKINKGSFSETGVFRPLAELRQYFSK